MSPGDRSLLEMLVAERNRLIKEIDVLKDQLNEVFTAIDLALIRNRKSNV